MFDVAAPAQSSPSSPQLYNWYAEHHHEQDKNYALHLAGSHRGTGRGEDRGVRTGVLADIAATEETLTRRSKVLTQLLERVDFKDAVNAMKNGVATQMIDRQWYGARRRREVVLQLDMEALRLVWTRQMAGGVQKMKWIPLLSVVLVSPGEESPKRMWKQFSAEQLSKCVYFELSSAPNSAIVKNGETVVPRLNRLRVKRKPRQFVAKRADFQKSLGFRPGSSRALRSRVGAGFASSSAALAGSSAATTPHSSPGGGRPARDSTSVRRSAITETREAIIAVQATGATRRFPLRFAKVQNRDLCLRGIVYALSKALCKRRNGEDERSKDVVLAALWKQADVDSSGSLQLAECLTLVQALRTRADARYVTSLFTRLCSEDESAVLEYDEFQRFLVHFLTEIHCVNVFWKALAGDEIFDVAGNAVHVLRGSDLAQFIAHHQSQKEADNLLPILLAAPAPPFVIELQPRKSTNPLRRRDSRKRPGDDAGGSAAFLGAASSLGDALSLAGNAAVVSNNDSGGSRTPNGLTLSRALGLTVYGFCQYLFDPELNSFIHPRGGKSAPLNKPIVNYWVKTAASPFDYMPRVGGGGHSEIDGGQLFVKDDTEQLGGGDTRSVSAVQRSRRLAQFKSLLKNGYRAFVWSVTNVGGKEYIETFDQGLVPVEAAVRIVKRVAFRSRVRTPLFLVLTGIFTSANSAVQRVRVLLGDLAAGHFDPLTTTVADLEGKVIVYSLDNEGRFTGLRGFEGKIRQALEESAAVDELYATSCQGDLRGHSRRLNTSAEEEPSVLLAALNDERCLRPSRLSVGDRSPSLEGMETEASEDAVVAGTLDGAAEFDVPCQGLELVTANALLNGLKRGGRSLTAAPDASALGPGGNASALAALLKSATRPDSSYTLIALQYGTFFRAVEKILSSADISGGYRRRPSTVAGGAGTTAEDAKKKSLSHMTSADIDQLLFEKPTPVAGGRGSEARRDGSAGNGTSGDEGSRMRSRRHESSLSRSRGARGFNAGLRESTSSQASQRAASLARRFTATSEYGALPQAAIATAAERCFFLVKPTGGGGASVAGDVQAAWCHGVQMAAVNPLDQSVAAAVLMNEAKFDAGGGGSGRAGGRCLGYVLKPSLSDRSRQSYVLLRLQVLCARQIPRTFRRLGGAGSGNLQLQPIPVRCVVEVRGVFGEGGYAVERRETNAVLTDGLVASFGEDSGQMFEFGPLEPNSAMLLFYLVNPAGIQGLLAWAAFPLRNTRTGYRWAPLRTSVGSVETPWAGLVVFTRVKLVAAAAGDRGAGASPISPLPGD